MEQFPAAVWMKPSKTIQPLTGSAGLFFRIDSEKEAVRRQQPESQCKE